MKLAVGQIAPDFTLSATKERTVTLSQYRGKNVVLVFFPQAWTPIWSGQIPSYEAQLDLLEGLNAQVLGISIDHVPCLEAWAESLGGITYPLLSDFWPHGMVARQYGVLRDEGYSERAIFIIDKEGIIRYIDIHDIDDQPNNDEIFAILRQIDPENAKKHPVDMEALAAELPHGGIVMYCNTWCPGCRRARAFFEANHLEYKEVDISRNRAAGAQVRRWANGYETTPTFDIDGQILVEFDEKRLREILGDRISTP